MPKLGETLQQGGYSLSATTVEDPATPGMFYKPETGKKLVAVEIIVGNVSVAKNLDVNALYATLIDKEGFTYKAELGSRDEQIETVQLAQGEKVRGWVAFKVPEATVARNIKYNMTGYSGPELQVELAEPTGAPQPTEASKTAVAAKPLLGLGEMLEQSGCQLSVTTLSDPAKPGQFYKVAEGKKLVGVEVIIGNVSAAKKVSINAMYANLVDADGFVYAAELGSLADAQIETLDLSVGEKIRGWIGFVLPISATPKSLKYNMTGFGGPTLQVGVIKSVAGSAPIATAVVQQPTNTAVPKSTTLTRADKVIAAFKAAGLEAENVRPLTKEDYGMAPLLGDNTSLRFFIPSLGEDNGGRLFVCASNEDAQKMKAVYDAMGKASAMFFSWAFVRDNICVQINGDLPEAKAKEYEAALMGAKL
jgi:hypothetical protein